MTIKITEQKNQILVRRWKYESSKKRSMPTTLYSVPRQKLPPELPFDVIKEHKVSKEEQQTFIDFVSLHREESEKIYSKVSLSLLTINLSAAKKALVDPELKHELTLEQYEVLSETVNEIKKLISKNKNSLARRERAQAKREATK